MKKSNLILLGALVFVMVMILVEVLLIRKNINPLNANKCNASFEEVNSQTIIQPAYDALNSFYST